MIGRTIIASLIILVGIIFFTGEAFLALSGALFVGIGVALLVKYFIFMTI